ncbi:MAG: hypothetical protein Q7T86_13245 [Hyphomicrobiaceae bacterium]|jgi:hypothetical protein|nr:hypothetical protein [Hyphomicrobiaceae bacterium]
MKTSGYTAEDLKTLTEVLDAAILEAAERDLDLPVSLMTRRLFDAARWGERDPARLKAEVLGDALLQTLAAADTSRWSSAIIALAPKVYASPYAA